MIKDDELKGSEM